MRRLAGLGLLLAACGAEAPPPAAPDAGAARDAAARTPTEKQEKALANALHRAHLEGEEAGACRDCHRIDGEEPPLEVVKHRCLGCHEDHRSSLHAGVADPEARECVSCHEFLEAAVDPWACGDCHRPEAEGELGASTSMRAQNVEALRGEARIARVHVEACGACHLPHGDAAGRSKTCLECHEEQTVRHDSSGGHGRRTEAPPGDRIARDGAGPCLECHGGHERGFRAKRSCAGCHEKPGSSLFEGHDRCTDCHRPHSKSGKTACRSCHSEQVTLAAERARDHARCESCHDPHRVERSALQRCGACHQTARAKAASHPEDEKKGACVGCHPQHPGSDARSPPLAAECTSCHEEARSDEGLHGGADCVACHAPHDFELMAAGDALCASCHVGRREGEGPSRERRPAGQLSPDRRPLAPRVAPIEDHATCTKCHVDASHTPEEPREPCGICHEDESAEVVPGHAECIDCHRAHDGVVDSTCASCHADKIAMGRHGPRLSDCGDCHGPHASRARPGPSDCESCHDEPLPLMHLEEGHGECVDCHGFHDDRKIGERVSCIAGCHVDQIGHEPEAPRCIGCHPFEAAPREVWR